ncbi:hypothetical protein TBLA_0G00560 [Henningerozyma blattae CBS 6284]|uniref:Condensin complex subunit 1 n=1 Tax=Henningerozyma blattae (strain ATCC 34711 / CBS 6284 / DSM 70876 / NBRC 10599 / NRRL Y-10934 / UCD 77-7) TaxID=1071380 RepID=I2H6K3_HENB6|nr:hypothetical protein TBLA_0G00560 [Tetrapisispora blattae CBS 6284]CCH62005.1 hypothetical protein TBLA_0G00560 [Tetrapisispora blattae CBS 6284]
MSDFSLRQLITEFQTKDKDSHVELDNPSQLINNVIDQLITSSSQLNPDIFESLADLSLNYSSLGTNLQTQLTDLVVSSFNAILHQIDTSLVDTLQFYQLQLEQFTYLMYVLLTFIGNSIHAISLAMSNKKKNNASKEETQLFKNCCNQIESIGNLTATLFDMNLPLIFQIRTELNEFLSLYIKQFNSLLQYEQLIKLPSLKLYFIRNLTLLTIQPNNQHQQIENLIITNLLDTQHLSNFFPEFLAYLNDNHDFIRLTDDVLKDISNIEFNSKDTNGPKSISTFLIKLSEVSPVSMLRQMGHIIKLLNNSSMTLRCAVVETCGNIVIGIYRQVSVGDIQQLYLSKIETLLDLLKERFYDSNPYVRTKAIQNCYKLIDLNLPLTNLNHFKLQLSNYSLISLEDKSPLVRRNSMKLLSKLLLNHPFNNKKIGSQLKLTFWKNSLQNLLSEFTKLNESQQNENETKDNDNSLDQTDAFEKENQADRNLIVKMRLLIQYHKDAIEFIEIIHKAINIGCDLIFSKNKNEVIEAMDFIVLTNAYDIDPSTSAIKKMLHLVWMKSTNDVTATQTSTSIANNATPSTTSTDIASHLIYCYKQLFLTVPPTYTTKERSNLISKNLINLTFNTSAADLASLEQLLILLYNDSVIDDNVLTVLWSIYNSCNNTQNNNFSKEYIHGSIIILGMLSLANSEIPLRGFDSLLDVGLGPAGSEDLELCRYTCIAIERLIPKKSNSILQPLPKKHEDKAVKKLFNKIIDYTSNELYYPMCEQAINSLFKISSAPDVISSNILKEKSMMTFSSPNGDNSLIVTSESRIISLTQLLFIVGQVAIKTLVYLENCETEFKKRKHQQEMEKSSKNSNLGGLGPGSIATTNIMKAVDTTTENDSEVDNELAMIGGGTNEDDFTDAINSIKEIELLFGDNSILGKFCPIVENIVSNSNKFTDPMLQRTATLCLEKLMCISSRYCEKNLPLLITVMEKSPDPIIRSNAVLGLGDMVVCFNNLIDENTEYLYKRLHDEDLMVQRTTLMTVTFLILAGQVKVRGQLGEMARCLENPDQAISDMCRLFFSELSTKDNAIYNGFIDIFSNLTIDQSLQKDGFKRIIRFLVSFIQKERHQKQLNEKLVGRLSNCTSKEQWDNIAFVINTIPYKSETSTAILAEGYKDVTSK